MKLLDFAKLFLLSCTLTSGALADPISMFDEGLRHYRENNFTAAIDTWENLIRSGVANGETYFNLGNAYYRTNQIGRAILNYERARFYLPNDSDLKLNLAEARRQTVDQIEPPLRLVVWRWIDAVRDGVSIRRLSLWIALLCFALAILAALRWLKPLWTPILLRRGSVAIALVFFLIVFWYGWRSALDSRPIGVVLVEKTDAYSGPDESSKQLYSLHEGTTVQIEESLSGWANVRLVDGRKGWIKSADIEQL